MSRFSALNAQRRIGCRLSVYYKETLHNSSKWQSTNSYDSRRQRHDIILPICHSILHVGFYLLVALAQSLVFSSESKRGQHTSRCLTIFLSLCTSHASLTQLRPHPKTAGSGRWNEMRQTLQTTKCTTILSNGLQMLAQIPLFSKLSTVL